MSLVENVRGIIEAHIAACEPPDAIARAAIAAVAEWLDNQIDLYGENHQVLIAALREQLEAKGTHGTPELDEDARKLAAMGQDPGATFAAEPAPVVCEWDSRTTVFPMPTCNPAAAFLNRIHRDGDMCPLCCKPIKFTEAKE